MKLRPPTLADADAIAAIFNDASTALYHSPEVSANDVRLWLDAPDFDLERDAVLAEAEDGTVVGYGDLSDPSRVGRLIWIDAQTRLGATDVANAILHDLERRAGERLAPDGRLKAGIAEKDTALTAVSKRGATHSCTTRSGWRQTSQPRPPRRSGRQESPCATSAPMLTTGGSMTCRRRRSPTRPTPSR